MRAIVCCGIALQLNYVNTAQLQGTLHTSRSSKRNESLAKVGGYNELKKLLARVVQDYIIQERFQWVNQWPVVCFLTRKGLHCIYTLCYDLAQLAKVRQGVSEHSADNWPLLKATLGFLSENKCIHTYYIPSHSPTPSRPNCSLSASAIIKFLHNRHAYYINGPINFQYSKLTRLICAENGQTEAIHCKGPHKCCLMRSAGAQVWHSPHHITRSLIRQVLKGF